LIFKVDVILKREFLKKSSNKADFINLIIVA